MKAGERIISFVVMLISVTAYCLTFKFPHLEGFETGPAFFPKMLSIILFILAVILLLQSYRSKTVTLEGAVKDALAIMGLMLVYLFLVTFFGFMIATPIILVIFLFYVKVRSWLSYIALPIGVTFFVYLVFQVLLSVPIPEGSMFG